MQVRNKKIRMDPPNRAVHQRGSKNEDLFADQESFQNLGLYRDFVICVRECNHTSKLCCMCKRSPNEVGHYLGVGAEISEIEERSTVGRGGFKSAGHVRVSSS